MSENAVFLESQIVSAEGAGEGSAFGAPSLQSLGAILRDRRESAGIMLADVEGATRIRQKYLAAIESDEWHLLPGEVVGRGFLRNYAYFLNLDPIQMIDRRRAMVDSNLSRSLASTSTGVRLPPVRPVDYRPKDVDLEHTAFSTRVSEFMDSSRDWLVPVVAALLIVLVILALGWGLQQMGGQIGDIYSNLEDRISSSIQGNRFGFNPQAGGSDGQGGVEDGGVENGGVEDGGGEVDGGQAVVTAVIPAPTATPSPAPPTATNTPLPTATEPAPPKPTATVTPTPTPTPTEEPPPEEVPAAAEEPPAPVAPVIVPVTCADGRLAIFSPGANQTVRGVVPVRGRAVHEQFDNYKLEFAPGAGATAGFTWFDGSDQTGSSGGKRPPVENGLLGNFNSAGLANGVYTLRLTVVDTSSNYPTPCQVTVNVQN